MAGCIWAGLFDQHIQVNWVHSWWRGLGVALWNLPSRSRVTPVSIQDGVLHGDQYGFFFLWSTVHPRQIFTAIGPSITVRRLFEFVHCPTNLRGISNERIYRKFLGHPVNKGLVPIHYKYFVRNLTHHHFLLSYVACNILVSINLTRYTLSKLSGRSCKHYATLENDLEDWRIVFGVSTCMPLYLWHLQAWMFHASGIILYTLQIVCYFNMKKLFNQ